MTAKRAVAVVGGGFSGTMAAVALAREGVEAVLVERGDRFAAGAAYSTPDAAHLLNVRARNMSAFPDAPAHFLDWVGREGLGDAETFVPRRAYRAYLAGILEEAVATGRVRLVHGTAVAAEADGLLLDGGERIGCRHVILAGGNYPSRLPAVFGRAAALGVDDPWSVQGAERLAALAAQGGDVLLVGTGLTMVDICLTLVRSGFRGRIVATSRRGLVPRGHDEVGAPPLPAPAPAPLGALVREVRAMARQGGWRPAVDSLRPVTAAIWKHMDERERARFLRHLRPWWDVHRHRIAPAVAARIATLREEGRLEIVAGRVTEVAAGETLGGGDRQARRRHRALPDCGRRQLHRPRRADRPRPRSAHPRAARQRRGARGFARARARCRCAVAGDRRRRPRLGASLRPRTAHPRRILGDRCGARHPQPGAERRPPGGERRLSAGLLAVGGCDRSDRDRRSGRGAIALRRLLRRAGERIDHRRRLAGKRARAAGLQRRILRRRAGGVGIDLDRRPLQRREAGESDRQDDEDRRQNGGRPRKEIGRAARRHQPRRAAADAEPAALRPLHQDHRDHGGGDEGLHDQEELEHFSYDFQLGAARRWRRLGCRVPVKVRPRPDDGSGGT
jgi:uncharacterized NAD(P)/FAD-binding protein YdhS